MWADSNVGSLKCGLIEKTNDLVLIPKPKMPAANVAGSIVMGRAHKILGSNLEFRISNFEFRISDLDFEN